MIIVAGYCNDKLKTRYTKDITMTLQLLKSQKLILHQIIAGPIHTMKTSFYIDLKLTKRGDSINYSFLSLFIHSFILSFIHSFFTQHLMKKKSGSRKRLISIVFNKYLNALVGRRLYIQLQVSLFCQTILNISHNFIPHEIINFEKKSPSF